MTIQATLNEVIALGAAIHGYKILLEQQPTVMPEEQEALELVRVWHNRLVASLPPAQKW